MAEHGLAGGGPIRETYLVDGATTPDSSQWRTDIGWPVIASTPPAERSTTAR